MTVAPQHPHLHGYEGENPFDIIDFAWGSPAMGFGVAVLIGLGPSARWPVLGAITVANFLANLSGGDPPQIAAATCLSEATECLVPALWVLL